MILWTHNQGSYDTLAVLAFFHTFWFWTSIAFMLLTQVLKGKKKQPKQSALYNTQALFSFPSLLFHHSSAVFTCVRILDRKENCVKRLELFIQLCFPWKTPDFVCVQCWAVCYFDICASEEAGCCKTGFNCLTHNQGLRQLFVTFAPSAQYLTMS